MKTMIERRLTVGYVRSSNKNDLSVKKQEKQIKKYCLKNCREVDKVFADNGYSGANLNRPALQKLLAEASKGNIFNVICLDADRLSRNRKNFLVLKSLFKKREVEIILLSGISKRKCHRDYICDCGLCE